MPAVSVILPVHNALSTLAAAAVSVTEQSCPDWELLLVDDGSTDGSQGLCDALAMAEPRIRVLHRPCEGIVSARNAGLAAAKSEQILFLDASGCLHPRALELALAAVGPDRLCLWPCTGDPLPEGCPSERRSADRSALARLFLDGLFSTCSDQLFSLPLLRREKLCFHREENPELNFLLRYLNAAAPEGFSVFHDPLVHCGKLKSELLSPEEQKHPYDLILAACDRGFSCPEQDLAELHRAAVSALCCCISDHFDQNSAGFLTRYRTAQEQLRDPWLTAQLAGCPDSPFAPGILKVRPLAVRRICRKLRQG